ncbi:aminotransferase class V-fold PLP-dependent enzyme [Kordiimonas gwangyangensis]|uniref:aminotransferase class V-fold PLP-dependent enzyme n=1 Tax=Kordiimonas gwangyangensis TaxID=288022 RepID=UPI0003A80DA0|nr:aminotransferase class V-fold PLP-dependent enzyme [Kordiimonas gwangyangensis]
MIDINAIRAETPGCRHLLHFNSAGAALMPLPVYDTVRRHLEIERDFGGYEAEFRAKEQLESFYTEFAALLKVSPDEIAFVENATRGWDMAFYGLPLERGDRIITHASEYASNFLAFLHLAKRRGVEIDVAPSDSFGQIDVVAMEKLVTSRTRVIAITHVPTQGGLVNPAAAVGKIARKHGLVYILDACQSVGQIELNVPAIGCHILTGTGRKYLRGPRGTGFLYVKRELAAQLDPPFIDLHAAKWTGVRDFELMPGAKRFENWESNVAGRVGLAAAVRYARTIGLKAIEERVTTLADRLRGALGEIRSINLHDQGQRKCGITTFSKDGRDSHAIAAALRQQSIDVSVSSVEYALLDLGARNTGPVVRASVHYYNTEAEVERFARALARL